LLELSKQKMDHLKRPLAVSQSPEGEKKEMSK
ncbi:unnamed protein product, partial [Rotaria sp. Silwood2]